MKLTIFIFILFCVSRSSFLWDIVYMDGHSSDSLYNSSKGDREIGVQECLLFFLFFVLSKILPVDPRLVILFFFVTFVIGYSHIYRRKWYITVHGFQWSPDQTRQLPSFFNFRVALLIKSSWNFLYFFTIFPLLPFRSF